MKRQITITERVKFLISHLITSGFAKNQEELGQKLGIKNKSYLSQLVNARIPNEQFIDSLINNAPDFNKEWLYDEAIESPFKEENNETTVDVGGASVDFSSTAAIISQTELLQKLQHDIQLLKKDVKYFADIAEMRLQTIDLQGKLIAEMEKNR
jgi:transcriptional regulator with XRE-family HTH domain